MALIFVRLQMTSIKNRTLILNTGNLFVETEKLQRASVGVVQSEKELKCEQRQTGGKRNGIKRRKSLKENYRRQRTTKLLSLSNAEDAFLK